MEVDKVASPANKAIIYLTISSALSAGRKVILIILLGIAPSSVAIVEAITDNICNLLARLAKRSEASPKYSKPLLRKPA
jgi:hypothetical protein